MAEPSKIIGLIIKHDEAEAKIDSSACPVEIGDKVHLEADDSNLGVQIFISKPIQFSDEVTAKISVGSKDEVDDPL